jgi:Arc/MetJ family transcription regulator
MTLINSRPNNIVLDDFDRQLLAREQRKYGRLKKQQPSVSALTRKALRERYATAEELKKYGSGL